MDPLSDLISLMVPESCRVGGFEVGGDWSIRFDAHEGVKFYAVTTGQCWLVIEGLDEPIQLCAGDCFLLTCGRPFLLADKPSTPPKDWRQYFKGVSNGALTRIGNGGETSVVGGHFRVPGALADSVLGTLPPIIHLGREAGRDAIRWAFEHMLHELADPRPGSVLITQQLAFMVLVQALRLHFESVEGADLMPALSDRNVGAAIAAIHRDPGRRWTVRSLATEVGMSRSSFAARFRSMMGEGPMEYVTRWRMLQAGRELAKGKLIGSVAQAIGYESETAFSAAFKRVMGAPPRRHARGTAEVRLNSSAHPRDVLLQMEPL